MSLVLVWWFFLIGDHCSGEFSLVIIVKIILIDGNPLKIHGVFSSSHSRVLIAAKYLKTFLALKRLTYAFQS